MIRNFPYELINQIAQSYYDKSITAHNILTGLEKTLQGEGHDVEIFMEISLDKMEYDFITIFTSETNPNGFCKHGEVRNGKKYIGMRNIKNLSHELTKKFFQELITVEWDNFLNWVDITENSIEDIGGVLNGLRNTASQLHGYQTIGFGIIGGNPNWLNDFIHLIIQFNDNHTKYRLYTELATEDIDRTDPATFTLHLATIDGTEDSDELLGLSRDIKTGIRHYLSNVHDVIDSKPRPFWKKP